ncbi:MAG TPA: NAD(P)H-quinone oxidoreductase [Actinobacteria bacterium]|jgi:putative PIG3 family NAD(P)H quinone oxidoreductase|nr:NAD(P)H-quinone oxidoreductase [Actinomycetota bacterium]
MFAITQKDFGGPETLVWDKVADPRPEPGEVIIDITSTAVNRADLLQREGNYPPPTGATDILGLECAGTIVSVGAALTMDRIGERVTALLNGGGYAQKVAIPLGQVMSIPEGVSILDAGALPEVACTVWSNLTKVLQLREASTILIHGGGSGIGTFAIQVAKVLGAKVAVTAGSQEKLNTCASLGADVLINYKEQDFVDVIRDTWGGTDTILDNMGASYLSKNVEALKRNGHLAIIGMQGGTKGDFQIDQLLRKNGTITATSLRGRPEPEKSMICREVEKIVWPWITDGTIKQVIDRIVPIEGAGDAHKILEASEATGKIVLQVR